MAPRRYIHRQRGRQALGHARASYPARRDSAVTEPRWWATTVVHACWVELDSFSPNCGEPLRGNVAVGTGGHCTSWRTAPAPARSRGLPLDAPLEHRRDLPRPDRRPPTSNIRRVVPSQAAAPYVNGPGLGRLAGIEARCPAARLPKTSPSSRPQVGWRGSRRAHRSVASVPRARRSPQGGGERCA
jgi:hypothetical protein